jgi:DNA polymerase III alpha subunit (gram-positive type)
MQTNRSVSRLELGRRRLAFLSVHATGFDPNTDQIVEVAVVMKAEGKPVRTYHRLIYPCVPILPRPGRGR